MRLASLEMSEHEVSLCLMAASAGVDLRRLRTGRLHDLDWHQLLYSLGSLADLPISFLPLHKGLSVDDLIEHCLELKRRGRLDLLIDYIQLLTADLDAPALVCDPYQALLGDTSEARWLRSARAHLGHLFPYLPGQSGYNKRLRRAASLIRHAIRAIAADTTLWSDEVWIVDSTPVECGRSRETAKRSELAGWAGYGWCASHSRWFWGLQLHLVCTLHGLPVAFALSGAAADERQVLLDILAVEPDLVAARPGQLLLADKHYYGAEFEARLVGLGVRLLRPARRGEVERPGAKLLGPLRQLIESVNDTFKGQLDLERHRGRTPTGVAVRVLQRILALTATIWHHHHHTGQPTLRSIV